MAKKKSKAKKKKLKPKEIIELIIGATVAIATLINTIINLKK